MAKGWSFNGLIQALKSAAFKDVGSAKGQVPLVGDKNLLDKSAIIQGFDFNTYNFVNNEVLFIEGKSSLNWPSGAMMNKQWNYTLTVLSATNIFTALLISGDGGTNTAIAVKSSGTWRSMLLNAYRMDLTDHNLNNFGAPQNIGQYGQHATSQALPGYNYPYQVAGLLEVLEGAENGVIQRYTAYTGDRVWTRANKLGGWTAWKEYVTTNSKQNVDLGYIRLFGNLDIIQNNGDVKYSATFARPDPHVLGLEWGSSTNPQIRRLYNTGSYTAVQKYTGWQGPHDHMTFRAPYTVEPVTTGRQSWFPLTTQKLGINGEGYNIAYSTGVYTGNQGYWPLYTVSCAMDNGITTNFQFSPSGEITFWGGNHYPDQVFATQNYVQVQKTDVMNWVNQNSVSDVGLGVYQERWVWNNTGYQNEHPWVITSVFNNNSDAVPDTVGRRPLYKHYPSRGWVVFSSM